MAKQILFKSRVKKARDVSLAAWETGLRSITQDLKAEVQELISTPYPPASRPQQPPHSRRGSRGLAGSITVVVEKGSRGRAATLVVKSTKPYANWVDKGTIKMKPRPFSRRVLTGGRRKTTLSKKWVDRIARVAKAKSAKSSTGKRRRR
jgi:hypothetical protein